MANLVTTSQKMRWDLRWITSPCVDKKISLIIPWSCLNNLQEQRHSDFHPTQTLLTASSAGHSFSKYTFGRNKRTQIPPWFLQRITFDPLAALLGSGTKLSWPTAFVDSKRDLTIWAHAFPAPLTAVKHRFSILLPTEGERGSTPLERVRN